MSTNSLSLNHFEELSESITREFAAISKTFQAFQHASQLDCLNGCAKCCFKPDIYCSPIELLPMALDLLKRGEAQAMYEKCLEKQDDRCMFLNASDEEKFLGKCDEYTHRPLICRTFGVSARHGKNNSVEFSVCQVLRKEKSEELAKILEQHYSSADELPFIDTGKSKLITLDPRFLEEERTINQSLKIILEKVLLYASYAEGN